MRLRYTLGSPFARAVRIVLAELGLDHERTEESDPATVAERSVDSPTLQVPALIDGNLKLWDSLVTIEYLLTKYGSAQPPGAPPPFATTFVREGREIEDRLQLATLQTLGAAVTNVSQFTWTGESFDPHLAAGNLFVARNKERLPYLLDWAETELASTSEGFVPRFLSVQDILLAVPLTFIDRRPIGLDWRSDVRPKTRALVDRLESRPSFLETSPASWASG
jgi:glutathione S-transferase